MSADVTWVGLTELKDELRSLPSALTAEASDIVTSEGTGAGDEIRAIYEAHGRSGDLARHLSVTTISAGQFGAGVLVKSSGKLARIFDNGTQARHWASGKSTGAMWGRTANPPTHAFVGTVSRRRRVMYARLKAMVVRHGLTVTGDV